MKDYGFRDQIQRASVSIMNNIAEGQARRSDKAFRNYLSIAKGSTAEVESMVIVASKLGYIEAPVQAELCKQCQDIAKLLSGLMSRL